MPPPLTPLRSGSMHKMGLGYPCPIAHLQVQPSDIVETKTRFFYLMDRGPHKEWVLLYFKEAPHQPTLELSLEELTSDQIHGLKGMFELKPSVTIVKSPEGIIGLLTNERTILLYSPTESEEWFESLKRAVSHARQSRSMPPPPENKPSVTHKNSVSTLSSSSPRRQLVPESDPFDDLASIFGDERLREKFSAFCRFAFAGENIDFYKACEDYELAVSDSERFRLSKLLVDKFVRENAPDQVNLSAEQRRLLLSAVDNNSSEAIITLHLMQAKREIFDLLRRNFFARFVAKEKDEESRLRLREHFAGVFSGLFSLSGLDAYLQILDHFALANRDMSLLASYINRRVDICARTSLQLGQSATEFSIEPALPQLKTLASAVKATMAIFQEDARITTDFGEELKAAVLMPVLELQQSVDSTLATIRQENLRHVDKIMSSRQLVERMRDAEMVAVRAKQAAEKTLAEEEAKKAKKSVIEKAKAAADKAAKEFDAACVARQEAEIKMVSAESECAVEIQGAMDALQSLALYRVESLQNLLSRFVLSEQHVLRNFDLILANILAECSRVDALADISAFAGTISQAATRARRASVARGQAPGQQLPTAAIAPGSPHNNASAHAMPAAGATSSASQASLVKPPSKRGSAFGRFI